jgi:hypothetical protein
MSKVSSSPERNTFQLEQAKERAKEDGKEVPKVYFDMWKTAKEQDQANLVDPEWQKNNLEYDLRSTEWIVEKVRDNDDYAQNIYAALCNNEFMKLDVISILKEQTWSCSWRHAGGIVADMLERGDYIDWYCSGISDGGVKTNGYVPEGVITITVEQDLKKLGWIIIREEINN